MRLSLVLLSAATVVVCANDGTYTVRSCLADARDALLVSLRRLASSYSGLAMGGTERTDTINELLQKAETELSNGFERLVNESTKNQVTCGIPAVAARILKRNRCRVKFPALLKCRLEIKAMTWANSSLRSSLPAILKKQEAVDRVTDAMPRQLGNIMIGYRGQFKECLNRTNETMSQVMS